MSRRPRASGGTCRAAHKHCLWPHRSKDGSKLATNIDGSVQSAFVSVMSHLAILMEGSDVKLDLNLARSMSVLPCIWRDWIFIFFYIKAKLCYYFVFLNWIAMPLNTERYGISQFGTIYIANDMKYDVRLRTPSSILQHRSLLSYSHSPISLTNVSQAH